MLAHACSEELESRFCPIAVQNTQQGVGCRKFVFGYINVRRQLEMADLTLHKYIDCPGCTLTTKGPQKALAKEYAGETPTTKANQCEVDSIYCVP